ncbi:MAG TPA: hypothetical protein VGC18_06870 [Lacisediminihabitans sp.]|uniref:hypothetical protein n=1 Tax=Lacisediminihabitans sp. TaxID=2787631 RepID=UPI002ED9DAA3
MPHPIEHDKQPADRQQEAEPPKRGVSRRTVLAGIGIGAAAVVVAGGAGVGVRSAVNGVWDSGQGSPYELWDGWKHEKGLRGIVAAGVLAANPHNTQAWLFRAEGSTIEVLSDPTRRMPAGDASFREHFAGLGCATENMVIAARARGRVPAVDYFPDGETSPVVARIVLTDGASAASELYRVIGDRHSNRGRYRDRAVPADVLSALSDQAAGLEGAGIHWLTSAEEKKSMGALLIDAAKETVADTAESREGFAWFRNNRADIDRHRDGLTLDGQELGGFTLFMAKVLPAESRTDGAAFWLTQTREVHTATAAAYGVITVPDVADRTRQVQGGRLVERAHLAATAHGLGFQHLNQITERIDRDRSLGARDRFSGRLGALIGAPASTALLAFRVGYPAGSAMRSPRRALADVLVH